MKSLVSIYDLTNNLKEPEFSGYNERDLGKHSNLLFELQFTNYEGFNYTYVEQFPNTNLLFFLPKAKRTRPKFSIFDLSNRNKLVANHYITGRGYFPMKIYK